MRNRVLALAGAVLAIVGITLGTAAATPSSPVTAGHSEVGSSDPSAPVVLPPGASTQAYSCGNTFEPPAPQGGPMYHTYKNCNGYEITVTRAYQNTGGQITAFDGAVPVQHLGQVTWYYPSTLAGVNYSTAIVRYP